MYVRESLTDFRNIILSYCLIKTRVITYLNVVGDCVLDFSALLALT